VSRSAARRDQAGFVGQHDGLDPVAEVELGEYPPDVNLDRALRQVQGRGDLPVGPAGGELGEDGSFPVGELAEQDILVMLPARIGQQGGELVNEPPRR
jgi:hypothetical protein